ncbi:ABC transporter substrate-binding protein [Cryobacterium sp. Y29]|uniref:ABC transporter substrate-binding protein n=1 Tax=Cryobacterium sp. Y29 TaxID=2048285 RepID=UPI000CE3A3AF|nr:ABC transporter substrate-binding protein [Cryobacterium sp. Y29]
MRRITSALAAASVAAVVLAGCSATAPESDAPVELTLWTGFTGGDRGGYEDLIVAFNESHDDIQVTMEVQPWDTIAQKLPSAWATGQGPDLATPSFDPNIVKKYLDTNSLLKLDDVGDTTLLAPAAVDAFTVDDTLYAVPANVATLQLYYNKSLFSGAGIEQPPTTVEEFKEDAAALSGDGIVGLSLADHETIQMWPILQWLEGGDIVDAEGCSVLDSAQNVAGLQSWVDLVNAGAAPVGLTGAESDSLFSAGKAAMQLNGPWAAAGYAEAGIDFGVAPVPVGVDGPVTLGSTVPMAASAQTKHPAEAQAFLEWWTGQDAQRQFALDSGFPPVRTDLADDSELAANEIVASFAAALPTARLYLVGVEGSTQIDSEAYVPFIGEITRGSDVADAAAAASAKINAITGCSDK